MQKEKQVHGFVGKGRIKLVQNRDYTFYTL